MNKFLSHLPIYIYIKGWGNEWRDEGMNGRKRWPCQHFSFVICPSRFNKRKDAFTPKYSSWYRGRHESILLFCFSPAQFICNSARYETETTLQLIFLTTRASDSQIIPKAHNFSNVLKAAFLTCISLESLKTLRKSLLTFQAFERQCFVKKAELTLWQPWLTAAGVLWALPHFKTDSGKENKLVPLGETAYSLCLG